MLSFFFYDIERNFLTRLKMKKDILKLLRMVGNVSEIQFRIFSFEDRNVYFLYTGFLM